MIELPEIPVLVEKIASQIIQDNPIEDIENMAFVGIQSNGDPLAKRLAKQILDRIHIVCPTGSLNPTLFRDDLTEHKTCVNINKTDISFSIKNRHIIVVDDVIHTGRTIRAALCFLNEFGRAKSIQCAALIDRTNREMPIECRYVGKIVKKAPYIKLKMVEIHGEDAIQVGEKKTDSTRQLR